MAYSTLTSVSPGDIITSTQMNLIRSNFEDHESRIATNESDIATNQSDISILQTQIAIVQNYISGLEISNGTDADHDIDITVGMATDSTNAKYLVLASAMTKQIDAAWAKGTNQGGLDTGSVGNTTFYYTWLIEEDATGDIDVLISASQTSPTMPAGWTAKAFTGDAVLTDGSANILGFRQKGNNFRFNSIIVDVSETPGVTTRVLKTLSIPPNYIGIISIYCSIAGNALTSIVETTDTDVAPANDTADIRNSAANDNEGITCSRKVDSSSQLGYRTTASTNYIRIRTHGFLNSKR